MQGAKVQWDNSAVMKEMSCSWKFLLELEELEEAAKDFGGK